MTRLLHSTATAAVCAAVASSALAAPASAAVADQPYTVDLLTGATVAPADLDARVGTGQPLSPQVLDALAAAAPGFTPDPNRTYLDFGTFFTGSPLLYTPRTLCFDHPQSITKWQECDTVVVADGVQESDVYNRPFNPEDTRLSPWTGVWSIRTNDDTGGGHYAMPVTVLASSGAEYMRNASAMPWREYIDSTNTLYAGKTMDNRFLFRAALDPDTSEGFGSCVDTPVLRDGKALSLCFTRTAKDPRIPKPVTVTATDTADPVMDTPVVVQAPPVVVTDPAPGDGSTVAGMSWLQWMPWVLTALTTVAAVVLGIHVAPGGLSS